MYNEEIYRCSEDNLCIERNFLKSRGSNATKEENFIKFRG